MRLLRDYVFRPIQTTVRITLGVSGSILILAGLFTTDILDFGALGIPALVMGVLLLGRAIL